jgi:Fic family protein
VLSRILDSGDRDKVISLLGNTALGPYDHKDRYVHWEKLRHLPTPAGYTAEEYWYLVKAARNPRMVLNQLVDVAETPFWFCKPGGVDRDLSWIDQHASGAVLSDTAIQDPVTKRTYQISSLVEEAITSSQLEGAATTRRVARDMIRSGRDPEDHSETMIFNNYQAMVFIRDSQDEVITPGIVFELHRILTEGTLLGEDANKAGRFRSKEDDICVHSGDDIVHVPPPAIELPERLQRLCDFINEDRFSKADYIHPLIRAIVAHFMIGYDHPFVDGNGRTARALFYLIMAREKYWLMEYVSISRVIKKSPASYMRAYLYTETDEGDLTYFIDHQLGVIRAAIEDLQSFLVEKAREKSRILDMLNASDVGQVLNHRQLDVIDHALDNPGIEVRVKDHQNAHGTSYETARSDLLQLVDSGLFRQFKAGKALVFIPSQKLYRLKID